MGRDPATCAGNGVSREVGSGFLCMLAVGFLCMLAVGFSTSTSTSTLDALHAAVMFAETCSHRYRQADLAIFIPPSIVQKCREASRLQYQTRIKGNGGRRSY
eukprot:COSAG02_NODE_1073_length_14776_cov_6.711930_1_plen_102_part_00